QPVVAFGIGERRIDEFIRGGAILVSKVSAEKSAGGHKDGHRKRKNAPDHTGHYRTNGTYGRTRFRDSENRRPKRDASRPSSVRTRISVPTTKSARQTTAHCQGVSTNRLHASIASKDV